MSTYEVSFMVVYSDTVEADSPEQAVELVDEYCPYDIDGSAWVTDIDTSEEWEV